MAKKKAAGIGKQQEEIRKPPEDNVIARITIRNASSMSPQMRREISNWLRAQGHSLVREGENYSSLFTAKYEV